MATLVYSDSDGRDRSFALGTEPVTVGRAPECTIRSDDPRVSRMHARFFLDQGGLWIEDLGSTHGIYVGPNKVQRAPVPPGEVVLIGSLLLRLVPASGTMPPPIGLHGTLATWLDLERKNRAAVEEERDAFARRVGELHQELAAARTVGAGATLKGDEGTTDTRDDLGAEAIRLRDEAEARAAALERALAAVQDELLVLRSAGASGNVDEDLARVRQELAIARDRLVELERDLADRSEWSTLVGAEHTKLTRELDKAKLELDEARSKASVVEHVAAEATRESQELRAELEKLRRHSARDLEAAQVDVAKAREGAMIAGPALGLEAAEKLAEKDIEIQNLQRQLAELKAAPKPGPVDSDARVQELTELVAVVTARAEKAEKELGAAQIRAQGAERNLSHANMQATKAETRAATLESKLLEVEETTRKQIFDLEEKTKIKIEDAEERAKIAAEALAKAHDRVKLLESRAGEAPLQAAEARAAKLSADLADVTRQLDASRGKITELESVVTATRTAKADAEARAEAIKAELAAAQQKLADADKRTVALQAKLDDLAKVDLAIASAAKSRDEAASRAAAAEQQVAEALRWAEDAEKRASAADTMAKAMAKDVAEALRRAADADTQKRAGAREHQDLIRRVEAAEGAHASSAAAVRAAEDRAAEAEAHAEAIRKELTEGLETMRADLAAKLEAVQKELGAKLEAAQRELAAERKTSLALVDRKTQLERELAEAKTALPAALARAQAAETRASEYEAQLEALHEKVEDLESSLAVAETANQASLAEAAEKRAALEKQLAEERQAAGKGGELIAELRAKIADLEEQIARSDRALADARDQLREVESRAVSTEEDREKLADALRRAADAERKVDALAAQAETADLAIGRAGALQRQLDEALSKLAFLERDSSRPREVPRSDVPDAVVSDRIAAAEARVKEAEARAQGLEARIRELEGALVEAERRVADARDEVQAALLTAQQSQQGQLELRQQIDEIEARARSTEEMLQEADARAQRSELQVAEMTARVAELAKRAVPPPSEALERQLFDAQRRIAELEREVANADNVRSFAAETEREIAQLQRDLRDARSKLTQTTLERDRLESELRDLRGDSETTNRRAPVANPRDRVQYDPEATAQADVSKYEPIVKKASELQQRVQDLEGQNATLRAQLAGVEERLREAIDRNATSADDDDDESEQTHTGSQLPIAFGEHMSVLEEAIDSLRANMRAASDETAMMEQSDSVIAVSSAVSQAAEHIERARAAIRAMNASIGIT